MTKMKFVRRGLLGFAGIAACAGAAFLIYRHRLLPDRSMTESLKELALSQPNVVIITMDTTRSDHLSCYGSVESETPNLDAIARQGILFRQCITAAPLTLPSHCSIMTGLYPTYHGVRVNGNTALSSVSTTMAEVFAKSGYHCGAFIGAFVLDGRWGLNQGFHNYDDQFDLKKYKKLDLGLVQRPGNQVMDAALKWLDGVAEKPFFAWIHLYDPHTPYEPPEPYLSRYAYRGIRGLYDGEIGFMDEQIGRCMEWLRQKGLDSKTIVALVGDHGEGLGEHGELTHGYYIYDDVVHVPFLMSTPFKSLQGVDVSTQVRTIDIFPTLCEAAGIPVPKEVQGKSLWPVVAQGGKGDDLPAYSESLTPSLQYGWSPLFSLRSAGYQYIDAPRAELYDLKNDPGEQINLNATSPLSAQKMEKALHEIIATSSTGAPVPVAADLDKETIERLASLGYVGAPLPQPSPSNSGKGLIDPKDMFDVYDSIQKAGELNNSEQYVQAAGILESVIKIDPENPQARLQLAAAYVELNRPAEAQEHLDHILKRDPNNIHALICLANILQKQGRPDDVIGLCEKAIQVDQRNTQAYSLIGESYMDENKFDQALPSLEKALAIQPKLTQNRLNLAACLIGLKQYSRAESMLDELIKESPKFPLAHFHLGLLFEEQGEMQKASQAYQDEITLYGNSYRARFNLGRLLLSQGNLQGYLDQMKEVVRIAPQNPLGRLFLARGLLRKGIDNDDVLDMVRQGLSFARTTEQKALGYFLLADLYNRRNQPQIAREALEKADAFKSQLTGRTQ